MSEGFLIVDGNAVGFAAASGPKLSVAGVETQAVYGSLRVLRPLVQRWPHLTPVILWDGRSWRRQHFAAYKEHRDDNPKAALQRSAYKVQRPSISRAYKLLGLRQMFAINMEADDLAGLVVAKARAHGKLVQMITADKDWLQLVAGGVQWFDPIHDRRCTLGNFEEMTRIEEMNKATGETKVWRGYLNPRQFLEGKALAGDAGDFGAGSGVGGIGEKGARQLLERFGSVAGLFNAVLDGSAGKLPKPWLDLVESAEKREKFASNLRLMSLDAAVLPKAENLKVQQKPFDRDGFEELCHELAFRSILKELDEWVAPFVVPSAARKAA